MRFIPALFAFLCLAAPLAAQPLEYGETIEIIVTTNSITIEPDFSGSDLYIAGVVEHADPLAMRNRLYDVIVVLEGPSRDITIREKSRRMGMWVNADSLTFHNVPQYYALATTRELRDITTRKTYERHALSLDYMMLRADNEDLDYYRYFRQALIDLKQTQHLYSQTIGTVKFGNASLFSARFSLPANVPVGHYQVRAYLFKSGAYLKDVSTALEISKAHLAYSIYHYAHTNSLWYGIIAVIVAILTGFIGRMIFRKD